MPETTTHETRSRVARAVARERHTRVPTLQDREQQAYLVTLEAEKRCPDETYLAGASRSALRYYCRRERSPVTLTQHFLQTNEERSDPKIDVCNLYGDFEERALVEAWVTAVGRRVREIIDTDAANILLGEATPAEVAKRRRRPIADIYNQARAARRKVSRDETIRRLWDDR